MRKTVEELHASNTSTTDTKAIIAEIVSLRCVLAHENAFVQAADRWPNYFASCLPLPPTPYPPKRYRLQMAKEKLSLATQQDDQFGDVYVVCQSHRFRSRVCRLHELTESLFVCLCVAQGKPRRCGGGYRVMKS